MTSVTGVSTKARSMARLPFFTRDPAGLGGVARQARHQLAEERALLEILSEAGVRGRNPVERQHLLHGVGIAEQHHDFLQVRAAHGLIPVKFARRPGARVTCQSDWQGAGQISTRVDSHHKVFEIRCLR
jgi:hypothetical protein